MRMKLFSVFTSVCLSILLMATFGCTTSADPVEVDADVVQEEVTDTVPPEDTVEEQEVEDDVSVEGEVSFYIMKPMRFEVAVASR